MYIHQSKVSFRDVDSAGVIFFPSLFCFYQEALESFFENLGFELSTMLRVRGIAFPVVHTEAEYPAALHLGDRFEIRLEVERVGESSIAMIAEFIRTDLVKAGKVRTIHVAVDTRDWKKIALPSELRQKLVPRK